jgi:hypothetical protein
MRVMKARKTLEHNAFIQEVIEQLKVRFLPEVPQIRVGHWISLSRHIEQLTMSFILLEMYRNSDREGIS